VTSVAVAPDKFAKGFDGSGRIVPDAYEVLELRALVKHHPTNNLRTAASGLTA